MSLGSGRLNSPPWHFPLLPGFTFFRGATGRHYIRSAVNLDARFAQHLSGHTATTKRFGGALKISAAP